jgi:hypothetical protein
MVFWNPLRGGLDLHAVDSSSAWSNRISILLVWLFIKIWKFFQEISEHGNFHGIATHDNK